MTQSTTRDPRVSESLAEHQELMRKVTKTRTFWREVCELGIGPKCNEMADRILGIRRLLGDHFAVEEYGGYMGNVLEIAPRFTGQAKKLCAQHAEFLTTLDNLASRLQEPGSDAWDSVCTEFDRFISDLQDHEHQENTMLLSAFNQDDGAGD